MSTVASDLVVGALFEMEDDPHPAQAFGDVAARIGADPEAVYRTLVALEAEGLVEVAERAYTAQGSLSTTTGWVIKDAARARRLAAGTLVPKPGPRHRLSLLAG